MAWDPPRDRPARRRRRSVGQAGRARLRSGTRTRASLPPPLSLAVMSALNFLAPRPFVHPETWEGIEYKWKFLVFRPGCTWQSRSFTTPVLTPTDFKLEGYILAAVAVYLVLFFYGKSANARKANAWFSAHKPLLEANFSKPAAGGLIQDGYSDFFSFSTGRRNVASLHTIFALRPRHDPFQILAQTGYAAFDLQYRPLDDLQLDFLLPASLPVDFVWALVNKDELRGIKKGRWDLVCACQLPSVWLG